MTPEDPVAECVDALAALTVVGVVELADRLGVPVQDVSRLALAAATQANRETE